MRTGTLVTSTVGVAILLLAFFQSPSVRADEGSVAYPDGYRSWTFLHSTMVSGTYSAFSKHPCVKPCTNGIFQFYANEKAMKGLRTGTYEDGSMIAEEMLEFKVSEKGTGGEGKRVLTAVMVKDGQRYAATDGWGYGNFDEGTKVSDLDAKGQQSCHQCHIARKDNGYVFAKYVDR